ncbi:MAG: deoxyribonuclease IV [Oscillospiraceae bacterium]|jgi:deoxyribonuclease-4|nr:deoxyribonuclease IV [Oscillospiraceae bacterium]
MFNIGCHLSNANGLSGMAKIALEIGANTFQFFTCNPRGASKSSAFKQEDINEFLKISDSNNFGKIVAHSPFIMNLCSAKPKIRDFSAEILKKDLQKMKKIPGNFYNLHPGNHSGQGTEAGIEFISESIAWACAENHETIVLLETMSGKGSEVGSNFDEISCIIKKTNLDTLGVCLDTCHIYDAGYDIVNNLDGVLEEFDSKIGISRLKVIHVNDSKNSLNSHKDRHEKIGQGSIGFDAITNIINNLALKDLVFILETPNDVPGYAKEIAILNSMIKVNF